jgi:F0F1-type ATP synthase assembly protein I
MKVYMTKQNTHQPTALIFLDIGWKVSLPLVFLVIIGSLLDSQFGTKPLFIIIGVILSIFVTAWVFYRLYKQMSKDQS